MTRVLLSGGSGFIAAHIIDVLLSRGHSVVATVRSQDKADKIKAAHPNVPKEKLDFTIVEDVAQEGAFDKAVISDPPFEAVLHTASPFHFNVKDTKKDLLDPAVLGTTGILKSIKKSAPTVRRVVVTSSFASILDGSKGAWPEHTYSEADWNPITEAEAYMSPAFGYRASKTFAERAAWEFVASQTPNFSLATINPPLVFGPIVHYLNSLSSLNTSNERIRNLITGQNKTVIPDTGTFLWVDVRDVALAHVKAMELDDAAGKRFFVTAGKFSNKMVTEIIRENFPEYASQLPGKEVQGGDFPEGGVANYDNSRAEKVLGLKWITLEKSVVDTVKSLQAVGA